MHAFAWRPDSIWQLCWASLALGMTSLIAGELPLENSPNNPYEEIDAVIVTGTRTEKTFLQSPYSANRLSDTVLSAERQARSLPDAMSETVGVAVQKTAPGQGSPFVRGWTGFRNLLLIDGVRVNNSTYREGPNEYWNTIDPYSLARIELVRGPNAVMFGSDAIGGTLQTFLHDPDTYDSADAFFGRALVRGATAENSTQSHLEVGSRGAHVSAIVGGSFKHFGHIQAAEPVGLQTGVAYDQYDVFGKVVINDGPHNKYIFAYSSNKLDNNPRTHQTRDAVSWKGTTVGSDIYRRKDIYRDLAYIQYIGSDLGEIFTRVHAGFSLSRLKEEEYRKRSNFRYSNAGYSVLTPGAFLQMTTPEWHFGEAHRGQLTVGADYYADQVNSFFRDYNGNGSLREIGLQGPVGDDAVYNLWGLFAQYDHWVNDRFNSILGLRFTHAAATVGRYDTNPLGGTANQSLDSMEDQWTDLSASLRLLYLFDDSNSIFGGATQGFRAPNLSDLTRLDDFGTSGFEVPSPNLRPEHFISFEIGFKHRSRHLVAQVAYFYTYIDSLIIRVPVGSSGPLTLFAKKNASHGFVNGVEIDGKFGLGSFHDGLDDLWLFGNASWLEGQVLGFDAANNRVTENLGKIPPAMAMFGLRWEHASQNYFGEVFFRWADLQDRLNTADALDTSRIPPGGTPSYFVLSARSGARFHLAQMPVRVSVAVENITDEDYRVHGSGSNEPGINGIGTVEVGF